MNDMAPGQDKPRHANILLVEDDLYMREMLERGLREAGHEVVAVATGMDAVEAARGVEFALGVFDLGLPGLSGLEAARQIRRETGLPFVVLSIRGDDAVVQEAIDAGALGYLVKPLDVVQIVPGIEAALQRAADLLRLRTAEIELRGALAQTRDISVAIGITMVRQRLNREAAFEHLRSKARRERRKLADLAAQVIGEAAAG